MVPKSKRPRSGDSALKSIPSSMDNKTSRWSTLGHFGRMTGAGKSMSSNSSPTHTSSFETQLTEEAYQSCSSQPHKGNSFENSSLSPCENGRFSGPTEIGSIGAHDCSSNQTHSYMGQQIVHDSHVPISNHSYHDLSQHHHQKFNQVQQGYAIQTPPHTSYPIDAQQMYSQSFTPATILYDPISVQPMMESYSSTPWIGPNLHSTDQIYTSNVEFVQAGSERGFAAPTFKSTNNVSKPTITRGNRVVPLTNQYMWAPDTIHSEDIYSSGIEAKSGERTLQSGGESKRFNYHDSNYTSVGSRPSRQASTQTSYSSDSIGADDDIFNNEKERSNRNSNGSQSIDEVQRHSLSVFQTKPLYALNEYEPLVTLGTGTFGRVILVRLRSGLRTDPKSYFALKVLNKADVVRLKQVAHTNNERDILSKVHHPFIVNLFSTYQDEKNCYMLMEYVVGGEVFSHLRKARRFTVDVTRFYISSLVLALAYLHSEKVLYRDLKPENLLLDEQGYIKIADFGFAKSLRKQERTWTLCGTPEYLSPEVIQSQGQSFASDYWALGILMYEMICGFPPFYDKTPFGTYEKILQAKLLFPKHVDECSKDLIQSFLTRDVTKRLGNLSGGANDVIRHPWFEGVDWQALLEKRIPAPIIPVQFHAGDSGNFQKYDAFDIAKMPALQNSQNDFLQMKSEEYLQSQFKDF